MAISMQDDKKSICTNKGIEVSKLEDKSYVVTGNSTNDDIEEALIYLLESVRCIKGRNLKNIDIDTYHEVKFRTNISKIRLNKYLKLLELEFDSRSK